MGRRKITLEEIETCWQLFCRGESLNFISGKTGISFRSIQRLQKKGKWDERLENVKKDAETIADARSSRRLARNLTIIKFLKEKIVQKVSEDKIEGNVSDVPNLIKTEELLVGNPDSRPEITHREPSQIRDSINRFAESLGLRIEFNGATPSRISQTLFGIDTSQKHEGGES